MLLPEIAQAQARTFNNPLGSVPTIEALLYAVVNVVLVVAVPIIVFFVVYAGFQYVTAQGNPEKIKVANRALMYAVIGAVIIMGSFAIAAIVENVVTQF